MKTTTSPYVLHLHPFNQRKEHLLVLPTPDHHGSLNSQGSRPALRRTILPATIKSTNGGTSSHISLPTARSISAALKINPYQCPSHNLIYKQYTRVAAADEPDLDLERDAHQHNASTPLELNESTSNSYKPHTHCEECDRQLERRERRRSKEHCCTTVSRTFMTIALFLMIFGIVAVISLKRGKK